ncbi:hypothetical protein L9F63_019063, partial [Diploptera punctata]
YLIDKINSPFASCSDPQHPHLSKREMKLQTFAYQLLLGLISTCVFTEVNGRLNSMAHQTFIGLISTCVIHRKLLTFAYQLLVGLISTCVIHRIVEPNSKLRPRYGKYKTTSVLYFLLFPLNGFTYYLFSSLEHYKSLGIGFAAVRLYLNLIAVESFHLWTGPVLYHHAYDWLPVYAKMTTFSGSSP